MGAGDADGVFGQHGSDFGDDAGSVGDIEADVVSGGGFLDGDEGSGFAVGEESAMAGGVCEVAGGFDEVGDDRGSGGALAGAAAVEERFTCGIGVDRDGIEHTVDGGEDVFLGNEGGLNAEFNRATIAFANDGEEFDHVAEGFCETDIRGADLFDAGDVDDFRIDGETVGERGEKDGLVGGVPAIDVEGGIGFGVAESLSFLKGSGVVDAAQGHLLEDVVRGAVDDAGEGMDLVADERVLNGFDDGDATGDGGFEKDGGFHFPGQGEQLDAALGEEGFVAGDDGLFRVEGGSDDFKSIRGASDQFDDDVDRGVIDEFVPIGGEDFRRNGGGGGTGFFRVTDEDFGDGEGNAIAGAIGDEIAVFRQSVPYAGADGAEAREADS